MLLSFFFGHALVIFIYVLVSLYFPTLCMIDFHCSVLEICFVLGMLLSFLFVHCFFFFLTGFIQSSNHFGLVVTHQSTYLIYLFHQVEFNLERISRIQQLLQKLSSEQD